MEFSDLIHFLENTCNELNSRFFSPREIEPLGIEGVTGRISDIDSFGLNCTGLSTLSDAAAEKTIRDVIRRYTERSKNFCWLVGPSSKPDNLGALLEKFNFVHLPVASMAGMSMHIEKCNLKARDGVIINKEPLTRLTDYIDLMESAYGFGETSESFAIRSKLIANSGDRGDLYTASLENSDAPLAYGVSIYYEKEKTVILQGAGTLPDFRGKGIYTSLVAARMNDAKKSGMETAVIQAIKSTSMPICQKIGFQKLCDIDVYAYGYCNLEHLRRVLSTI